MLVERCKLDQRLLDEGPRPKRGKVMCLLHGIILEGNTALFMVFSVMYSICKGYNCILCIQFADVYNF
jgi:hypothetical protein